MNELIAKIPSNCSSVVWSFWECKYGGVLGWRTIIQEYLAVKAEGGKV